MDITGTAASAQSCGSMNQFFAAIDQEGAILNCAEMVANSIDRIPGFDDCLAGVRKWIRTPVDQRSADILLYIKPPMVKKLFDDQPLGSAIFGATVVRIASTIFANHGSFATIDERLQDGSTVDAISKFIAKNPCFVGELIVESTLRADRDEKFLNLLNTSIRDLEELIEAFQKTTGGDRIMARMKSDPTSDDTGTGGAQAGGHFAPVGCAIGSSSTKGETATCAAYMVITVIIILCFIFC